MKEPSTKAEPGTKATTRADYELVSVPSFDLSYLRDGPDGHRFLMTGCCNTGSCNGSCCCSSFSISSSSCFTKTTSSPVSGTSLLKVTFFKTSGPESVIKVAVDGTL